MKRNDANTTHSLVRPSVALLPLIAAWTVVSSAQLHPTLKVKLDVSPAVEVSSLEGNVQASFAEQLAHLDQLVPMGGNAGHSLHVGPGFAISAFENITVLVSVTQPVFANGAARSRNAARITCGYLNDGTTYFRRSTITNKSSVGFRLRNIDILRHSMKLQNPLLVAYVFFIVDERKEAKQYDGPMPVSNVTVEFL